LVLVSSFELRASDFLARFGFEVMANHEFEEHEAKARASGEAGVEQPESGRRHRLVKAADPADETVGAEEGQIIGGGSVGVRAEWRLV